MVERIKIDWPDELERIAGESPNPGGYEAGQLRSAARAWRAERVARMPREPAMPSDVGSDDLDARSAATGQPGGFRGTRGGGRPDDSDVLLVCNVRRGAFSGEFYYSLHAHGDPEPVCGTAPIGDLVEVPGISGSITFLRGRLVSEWNGLAKVVIRDLQTTQTVMVMSSDLRRES